MVAYTKNYYIVSFDSTSPSANLKKIVHSLADNVSQLSICEEHETTSTTYYSGILKYSGYSNFTLKFGVVAVSDSNGVSHPQLKIAIGSENLTSSGDYTAEYGLSKYATESISISNANNIFTLNDTSNSFSYNVMTFDDVVVLVFFGINSSSGAVIHMFGKVMLCPLVDMFTSEKLAGILFMKAYAFTNYESLDGTVHFAIHNGKASQSYYRDNMVVVGGKYYYAGENSVASPIVLRSGNYSTIPFYGFAKDSEFLYQIRTGSSGNPLDLAFGAKVEIGGHTFVSIGFEYFFARIS